MIDRSFARRSLSLLPLAFGVCVMAAACDESAGQVGGFVVGAADTHCGVKVQKTSPSACLAGDGGGSSSSSSGSSSSAGAGGGDVSDYGPTLFNAEGDDDDCKYHAKVTTTSIFKDKDVTFTVVATSKTDGTPVTGAKTLAEVFLSDTHPGPNTPQKVSEGPNGTYTVGPVRFDASGRWTVRFHFFGDCTDGDESPHSHVAFFIDIP